MELKTSLLICAVVCLRMMDAIRSHGENQIFISEDDRRASESVTNNEKLNVNPTGIRNNYYLPPAYEPSDGAGLRGQRGHVASYTPTYHFPSSDTPADQHGAGHDYVQFGNAPSRGGYGGNQGSSYGDGFDNGGHLFGAGEGGGGGLEQGAGGGGKHQFGGAGHSIEGGGSHSVVGGHGHKTGYSALALKGILIPLAGIALLGVAAALSTNPVLLQLGVINGRRKRSLRGNADGYPPNPRIQPDRNT